MSEELKPCPFCGGEAEPYQYRVNTFSVRCKRCKSDCGCWKEPYRAEYVWNSRPIEDEKDKEIARLIAEIDNLQHFCDSILDMAKRNNGVLYFKQDSGTWKIETGKDTDVPANDTDNY
jgi:hypothetical protein